MPVQDPVKNREYRMRSYRKNRAKEIRAAVERKQRNRDLNKKIVREAKARPCKDCGVSYPTRVMEFDHCRGIKKDIISRMVNKGVSARILHEEIAKCDVVCANCHRIRTFS